MQKYKNKGNRGLFDEEMTCDKLSEKRRKGRCIVERQAQQETAHGHGCPLDK